MQPPYDNNPTPSYNDPIPSVPEGFSSSQMAPVSPVTGGPPSGPPTVRFEIIGEAWTLFQQQMATWVLATLIYYIIIGVPSVLAAGPMYYRMLSDPAAFNADPSQLFGPMLGFYAVIFLFVVPASVILSGGLYRMAIRQIRGENIAVGDFFKIFDVAGALIGSVFLVGFAVVGAAIVGLILCGLPGLVVGSLLMLTVPLIVDRRIGSMEAIKLSWNALKPHWLMATLFYLVVSFIGNIGSIACYIGVLFTFPIFILSIALLYRDFFDRREFSPSMGNVAPPHEPPTGFGYTPQ